MSYIQKSYFKKYGNKDNSMEGKIIEDINYLVEKSNNPEPALPYKVYTALLTQSGGPSNEGLNSGELTIGVTYTINDYSEVDDFTNVGAPSNANGVSFVATGTTPSTWIGGTTLVYNTAAPVVTVLEDTTGLNLYWTYLNPGVYVIQSSVMNNWTLEEKNFYKSKIAVFVNLPTRNDNDNSFTVTAGYYADGPDFFVLTGDGGATINDVLSDADGWLRTSLEIRVYN